MTSRNNDPRPEILHKSRIMRFSILGALLGTVALAGAGGAAITQTSATEPLRITDTSLNARVALAGDPSTSPPPTTSTPPTSPTTSPSPTETPAPTESPTTGEYTAEAQVVKRRGVSYLNVSVTYEGAALFNVKQRVCKKRSCKTADLDFTVVGGEGSASKRLGSGTYKKRGQAAVTLAPLPTVTVRETVTVTEPGPTVTVTEPGPTVTETFTCQPTVEPTDTLPPTDTVSPTGTVTPTDTVAPTGTVTDTPPPSETVTPTPTETATDTPTETPTAIPTDSPTAGVSPTDTATEIPTCPPPSEPPTELPTETPAPTDTTVPTETSTTTATPSESVSAPAQ
ncbi:hypothetical protein [Nonomuraea insulae]|uniref:Uncharacterized protein n=1 Tax=Nonomuraea insulae TaxID=1616787 RepID=A0ABW1D2L7_9ACTN